MASGKFPEQVGRIIDRRVASDRIGLIVHAPLPLAAARVATPLEPRKGEFLPRWVAGEPTAGITAPTAMSRSHLPWRGPSQVLAARSTPRFPSLLHASCALVVGTACTRRWILGGSFRRPATSARRLPALSGKHDADAAAYVCTLTHGVVAADERAGRAARGGARQAAKN